MVDEDYVDFLVRSVRAVQSAWSDANVGRMLKETEAVELGKVIDVFFTDKRDKNAST